MKQPFFRLLSYLCIITFLIHWVAVFTMAVPSNTVSKIIVNRSPGFLTTFTSWKFFTPPYTFNNRLYFIVRDINGKNKADTIEVLANISLQKYDKAPFNQEENIIDHLVNHDVGNIKRLVWQMKKKPTGTFPGNSDSLYIASAVAEVAYNNSYRASLATLNNYYKVVLKEKNIDTLGKEIKIVITEKKIRPFKNIADSDFPIQETISFETAYNPINK